MNREPIGCPEPVVPGFEPGTTTMASKRVTTALTGPSQTGDHNFTYYLSIYFLLIGFMIIFCFEIDVTYIGTQDLLRYLGMQFDLVERHMM